MKKPGCICAVVFWDPRVGWGFAKTSLNGINTKVFVHLLDQRALTLSSGILRFFPPKKSLLIIPRVGTKILGTLVALRKGFKLLDWIFEDQRIEIQYVLWLNHLVKERQQEAERRVREKEVKAIREAKERAKEIRRAVHGLAITPTPFVFPQPPGLPKSVPCSFPHPGHRDRRNSNDRRPPRHVIPEEVWEKVH